MGGVGFVVWTAAVAGVVAFLWLGFTHWAVLLLAGRPVHRLVAYVVGLGEVLAIVGVWCVVQVMWMPAWWVWVVMCWVSMWAGLGTAVGWWLDGLQGRRVEEGVRRGQQRAAADRDC